MTGHIQSFAQRFTLCLALVTVAGCGGDDDDTANKNDDTGKKSGAAGKDAVHFIDAGDPLAPVECGERTCETADDMPPCCVDEKTSYCGFRQTNMQCTSVADPRCPSVSSMVFGEINSCCTIDNQCGLDQGWTGSGCVSLASPMLQQFMQSGPKPRACDAADAGMN